MTNHRLIFYIAILGTLALVLGFGWFKSCQQQPEPVTPAKSEQARHTIINTDSIKRAYEAKEREAFLQGKLAGLSEFNSQLIQAANLKQKEQQSQQKYLKNKTIENCDTLLAIKDQRLTKLDSAVIAAKKVNKDNDSIITSLDKSLTRSQMVIGLLNDNLKDSNARWQADLDKTSKGRYSLYGAVQVGTDLTRLKSITPTAVLTTPKGWLVTGGYDVMRGEYTAGGGVEIRFGR